MEEWEVEFHVELYNEYLQFSVAVRMALAAEVGLLQKFGPELKRFNSDTLKGSRFANMKELRFTADGGEWRVAYAFDPLRRAILLVAGDKSGVSEARFYRQIIRQADRRFDGYLKLQGRTSR
jgi:hypothetical protein